MDMNRVALTFTVRPGRQPQVARLLSGYCRPPLTVDCQTRLLRTSVFLGDSRVVRVIDVVGDLAAAFRHLAAQPEVQAVERSINEHLKQPRDLSDPTAARSFFARATLPRAGDPPQLPEAAADPDARHAVLLPVRTGRGEAVARLLAQRHGAGPDEPAPTAAGSTVFHREDVVVWLLDGTEPAGTVLDQAAAAGARAESRAGPGTRLGDLLTATTDLTTEPGFRALLTAFSMELITDRRAALAS
jgi:hypothetical protein